MKQIVLVRYGSWEDGHLNEAGRQEMNDAANRLSLVVEGKEVCIIAGNVARAIESAKLIAQHLNLPYGGEYDELYAAEEDGKLPDAREAFATIQQLDCEMVVAVVSREHIETLPVYISKNVFNSLEKNEKSFLGRGEALIIDLQTRSLRYLG